MIETSKTVKFLIYTDALRSTAILLVIIHHMWKVTRNYAMLHSLSALLAWYKREVFIIFIASTFYLGSHSQRGVHKNGENFIRRFSRIATNIPFRYSLLYPNVVFKLLYLGCNQRYLHLVLFLTSFFTWHKSFWLIVWFLRLVYWRGDDVLSAISIYFLQNQNINSAMFF
jgi:hypothetical protein